MTHFVVRTDIAAAPERVWQVMSDIERWPTWTASIASLRLNSSMSPGMGSGVRIRQPLLFPATWIIIAWEPGRGFDWVSHSMGVRAVASHAIAAAPGGSTVTLTLTFEGVLARPAGFLGGPLTRYYMQTEANGLKAASERTSSLPDLPPR